MARKGRQSKRRTNAAPPLNLARDLCAGPLSKAVELPAEDHREEIIQACYRALRRLRTSELCEVLPVLTRYAVYPPELRIAESSR